jgi:DNA-binding PadR family transcriptional regulator
MTTARPARREKRTSAQTRAAEHALLGLLAQAEPGSSGVHGYDLLRQFADGALSDIIRIEPGMLYHHLKSLAKRGLLVTTVEHQATRPDRQMHAITEAGRVSLDEWMEEPVRATRELRLEFLVKLYLAQAHGAAVIARLIAAQREVIDRLISSLEEQGDALDADAPDAAFRHQVLELRLAQNRAARAWLDSLQADS